MIANQRAYRIAKAARRRFEDSLGKYQPGEDVDPKMREVMDDALKSEIDVLTAQIERYEDLRDGRVDRRELDNLGELPVALIEARIAAGLTQKALADRLGLKQQQVQRWEANRYEGVGVERLRDVANALGVEVHTTILYAISTPGLLTA